MHTRAVLKFWQDFYFFEYLLLTDEGRRSSSASCRLLLPTDDSYNTENRLDNL